MALQALAVALTFLGGKIGLLLGRDYLIASPIWPPAGLALGCVLIFGYRLWPGLLTGAFLLHLVNLAEARQNPIAITAASLCMASGETLQALVAAWLAETYAGGRDTFRQPRSIALFFALTAFVSPAISATSNSLASLLAGLLQSRDLQDLWASLWLGNMLGVILLTPLMLAWSNRSLPKLSLQRGGEAAILFLLLLIASVIAFGPAKVGRCRGVAFSCMLIPTLLWTAFRFGARGTVTANFLFGCLALLGTLRGHGPFVVGDSHTSFLLAQNFIAAFAIMALLLAAEVKQRQRIDDGLRASEQRYRDLFEYNPQPMWVYDYETLRFLAVNQAAIRHYGYSRDEFLSMTITDIRPQEDVPGLLEILQQARRGLEVPRHHRHRKKDRTLIDVEIGRYNLMMDGREAAMILVTDITARKAAEDEVLRLNRNLERRVVERTAALEAINQELESFSYSVSHDLRAPLRSIRGFSEVLLDRCRSKLDERSRELLERVCESSHQMDLLIDDLLKLSRIGRVELHQEPVNLSALAESIALELRAAEPKRAVKFAIAPGLKACGDGRLLRIALENLLRNAWKFTANQAKAKIQFGETTSSPQAYFVRDNGAGFDMAYASRLFGVFQRLHSASEFPGSGIGLATVQRILTRHGGRAWAEAAVNQGATFYFSLPRNSTTKSSETNCQERGTSAIVQEQITT